MKKIFSVIALVAMVVSMAAESKAATEVRMTGDFHVYGSFRSMRNFTDRESFGRMAIPSEARKEEKFAIIQRFRLRTDFIANESLKFRLGIRVDNSAWGDPDGTIGAYDVNNASVDVYQAYLQFMWPGTEIQFTIGKQDLTMPGTPAFGGSLISDTESNAIIIDAPLIEDTLSFTAGFSRLYDLDPVWNDGTRERPGDMDMFFLTLPITLEGFSATPWAALLVTGREVNDPFSFFSEAYQPYYGPATLNSSRALGMSEGQLLYGVPGSSRNSHALTWWAGTTLEITRFEPIRIYADVIWGYTSGGSRANSRSGWFLDAAIEYTGLDWMTPQFGGWWSSGEDKSTANGSERLPHLYSTWGAGGSSFLFDSQQALSDGESTTYSMGVNPVGTWGLFLSFKDITFLEGLSHTLTFAAANGTSSPSAIRRTIDPGKWGTYAFVDQYYTFGRDLSSKDWVFGINLDTSYKIYENLTAIVETGWAHGSFAKSVWGSRLVEMSRKSDSWKVAFGLQYDF